MHVFEVITVGKDYILSLFAVTVYYGFVKGIVQWEKRWVESGSIR